MISNYVNTLWYGYFLGSVRVTSLNQLDNSRIKSLEDTFICG